MSWSGYSALHGVNPNLEKGSKHDLHIQRIKQGKDLLSMLYYIKKVAKQSSVSPSSISLETEELIIPCSAKNVEIRWALKVFMSHYSLRSCLDINNLFKAIFLDVKYPQNFK